MHKDIRLSFITRDNVDPRGKAKVYFSYHPEDFLYLDHISKLLLKKQDCAIYYYEYAKYEKPDTTELLPLLREMELIVVPVTANYLFKNSIAFDFELRYAIDHHIPVLPLLQDSELGAEFNRKCANLQYLDEYSKSTTAISFDSKLDSFLSSVLVGDETVKRIQAAFDAYIFLSYRKIDREYAQELMSLVHANPLCRDIAIWYDEFLVPGEPFDAAIEAMLIKSDLFALLVTPNLVNEDNYVHGIEYPLAKKTGKKIIAAEAKYTSKRKLKKLFNNIPKCVKIKHGRLLHKALLSKLKGIALRENNTSEHNFLIGLAYLSGIDVEINSKYAIELITSAAEDELEEAILKLVDIYYRGIGTGRDIHKAIYWEKKYVNLIQPRAMAEKNKQKQIGELMKARTKLADYLLEGECLIEAEKIHIASIKLLEELINSNSDSDNYLQNLLIEYGNTSCFYLETGNLCECEKLLLMEERLAKEKARADSDEIKGLLAICYSNLGALYREITNYDCACEYFNKSLDLLNDLVFVDSDKYSHYLINVYDFLGSLYHHTNDAEKAKMFLDIAIKGCEHLAAMDPDVFKYDLAVAYNNAFAFYGDQNEYVAASEYLEKAIKLNTELSHVNPERYRKLTACCYRNAGSFYSSNSQYEKAGKYLLLSIDLFQILISTMPERFSCELADAYNLYGVLNFNMHKFENAKLYYKKSLDIYLEIYNRNPDCCAIDLAVVYNNMGHLFMQSDADEARKCLTKAIVLFEKCDIQSDIKNEGYYTAMNNLGLLCTDIGDFDQAQIWLKKALDICKQMSMINPDRYNGDLAFGYNNIGILLMKKGSLAEAIEYFKTAIKIFNSIISEKYRHELAVCYANVFTCQYNAGDQEGALQYLLKAISEYEIAINRNPGLYNDELSRCYYNAGVIYENIGDQLKAERYFEMADEITHKSS